MVSKESFFHVFNACIWVQLLAIFASEQFAKKFNWKMCRFYLSAAIQNSQSYIQPNSATKWNQEKIKASTCIRASEENSACQAFRIKLQNTEREACEKNEERS